MSGSIDHGDVSGTPIITGTAPPAFGSGDSASADFASRARACIAISADALSAAPSACTIGGSSPAYSSSSIGSAPMSGAPHPDHVYAQSRRIDAGSVSPLSAENTGATAQLPSFASPADGHESPLASPTTGTSTSTGGLHAAGAFTGFELSSHPPAATARIAAAAATPASERGADALTDRRRTRTSPR
ncbi:MAG: hypothetical protein R3F14_14090 [Polyangiaceae bacterium]